jgi:hypothetical protein
MKYQVLVEKQNETYTACCPVVPHLRVTDGSVNSVLAGLRREFLCYVHDPDAELEIMLNNQKLKIDTRPLPMALLA